MGGASYNPYSYVPPPDSTLQLQALRGSEARSRGLLDAYGKLSSEALKNQGSLLNIGASRIPKTYVPDLPGLKQMAFQEATINAANKRALERAMSPDAAALRENLPKALSQQLQMFGGAGSTGLGTPGDTGNGAPPPDTGIYNDITKMNLARLFGSGVSPDSTIGRSGLFDASTVQGMQLKRQAMQDAAQYLQQNPLQDAGIDPGQLIAMQEGAKQQNITQENEFKRNVFGGAVGLGNSMWNMNQGMLGAEAQAENSYNQGLNNLINANQQDWNNYFNLGSQAAAQNAAGQNSMTGAYIGGAGAIGMGAAIAI